MTIEEIAKALNINSKTGKDLIALIYLDGFSDGYDSAVANLQEELKKLKNLGNKGLPVIIQKPSQLPTTKPNKEDSDSSK